MAPKSPKGAAHADGAKRGLSRRQILESSALLGGALASGVAGQQAVAETATTNADNLPPNVPEWMKAPGDPMGSQLYGMPSPFEKNVVKNISKKTAAIYIRCGTDAAAGSRWHHHAERTVLRTPSRRRSHHRPRAASADAARPGGQAFDLHDGRHPPLPIGVPDPLYRMFRQPGLHQALRHDRF